MGYILYRWLLFFLIGLPFQVLTYILYPFAVLYIKYFTKDTTKTEDLTPFISSNGSLEDLIRKGNEYDNIRDTYYDNSQDSHNALIHAYLWAMPNHRPKALGGLKNLLNDEYGVIRIYPPQDSSPVSIDCLSAWMFGYVISETKSPEMVIKLAWHYLKYCLGIKDIRGKVSARCSNSGINYCFDGWKGLNQPAFGPAYYCSAALFSLAAKEAKGLSKVFWKSIYYAHFLVMGGWLWWIKPKLEITLAKGESIYYVNHVTSLCLYVLAKSKGLDPLTKYAFKDLCEANPYDNIDPWMYTMALDVGVYDRTYIKKVEDTILTFNHARGFMWQKRPATRGYFENTGRRWFHLGSIAYMLKNVKEKVNK
jgi:hypothetical protein